jgi:hypothetical protein
MHVSIASFNQSPATCQLWLHERRHFFLGNADPSDVRHPGISEVWNSDAEDLQEAKTTTMRWIGNRSLGFVGKFLGSIDQPLGLRHPSLRSTVHKCCQHSTIVDNNIQSAEYSHQMFARSRQSHQDEVRQLELSGAGHCHRRKSQKNGGSKITRCSSNSQQYQIGVINHIIIEPSAASHIRNKKGVDRNRTISYKSQVCKFATTP